MARQKLYTSRMEPQDTVETFAARLRRRQTLLHGAVSEGLLKKTLIAGLSPQLQLFAENAVNRPNQTFALLVAYLSDIHAKLGRAPTTTPVRQAPSILRRPNNRDLQTTVNSVAPRYSHDFTDQSVPEHQSSTQIQNRALETDSVHIFDAPEFVELLTAYDMRSWICAGCRNFGHPAWLCPFLPEDVRARAQELRETKVRCNRNKDG
jgi:hypothetical protein